MLVSEGRCDDQLRVDLSLIFSGTIQNGARIAIICSKY